MARLGWMTTHRPGTSLKRPTQSVFSCRFDKVRIPTLSQWLGSFPTESRAIIFPQCRQDCPLPLFINIGGFHGLREETIGSKFGQKPANFLFFLCNFLSFLSLSLHRGLRPPPSNHYCFIIVSTTSGHLNSSPAAKHKLPIPVLSPADFLLLLSSCFATWNQLQLPASPLHVVLHNQIATVLGSFLLFLLFSSSSSTVSTHRVNSGREL